MDAAQTLELPPEEAGLARRQVSGSDLVVLNKIDLIDEARRREVESWIREIRRGAKILEADHGRLLVEVLLGAAGSRDGSGLALPEHHHDHGVDFETWAYRSLSPLRLNLFREVLNHLPAGMLRAKGFLYSSDAPNQRLLFQLVGRWAVISEQRPWGGELPETRLVFITRADTCNFRALGTVLDRCIEGPST